MQKPLPIRGECNSRDDNDKKSAIGTSFLSGKEHQKVQPGEGSLVDFGHLLTPDKDEGKKDQKA